MVNDEEKRKMQERKPLYASCLEYYYQDEKNED